MGRKAEEVMEVVEKAEDEEVMEVVEKAEEVMEVAEKVLVKAEGVVDLYKSEFGALALWGRTGFRPTRIAVHVAVHEYKQV